MMKTIPYITSTTCTRWRTLQRRMGRPWRIPLFLTRTSSSLRSCLSIYQAHSWCYCMSTSQRWWVMCWVSCCCYSCAGSVCFGFINVLTCCSTCAWWLFTCLTSVPSGWSIIGSSPSSLLAPSLCCSFASSSLFSLDCKSHLPSKWWKCSSKNHKSKQSTKGIRKRIWSCEPWITKARKRRNKSGTRRDRARPERTSWRGVWTINKYDFIKIKFHHHYVDPLGSLPHISRRESHSSLAWASTSSPLQPQ